MMVLLFFSKCTFISLFHLSTQNHKEADLTTPIACCSCCRWLSKAVKTKSMCPLKLLLFLYLLLMHESQIKSLIFITEDSNLQQTVRTFCFVTGLSTGQTVTYSRGKKRKPHQNHIFPELLFVAFKWTVGPSWPSMGIVKHASSFTLAPSLFTSPSPGGCRVTGLAAIGLQSRDKLNLLGLREGIHMGKKGSFLQPGQGTFNVRQRWPAAWFMDTARAKSLYGLTLGLSVWNIRVWWGQVSKNDLLCTVMTPKKEFELQITYSPELNLKFSYMKSLMEKKKYTHKWFRQCHPFYCSNSHSDYKIITNQIVCLVFANLKKELRELLTANKWRLKLPNTLVQQLQTRSCPAHMASTYVTMTAVSQRSK